MFYELKIVQVLDMSVLKHKVVVGGMAINLCNSLFQIYICISVLVLEKVFQIR